MLFIKIGLFLVSVLWSGFSFAWTHGNTSTQSGQFFQLPIGAGGYVLDEHFANDGTAIVNTDTANAFIRPAGATAFVPIVTAASINATDSGNIFPGYLQGVCATAISPTNSQHIYLYWSPNNGANVPPGNIYSSTNQGATLTKAGSGFPSATNTCGSNSNAKLGNSYMAVSPGDENTLYVVTPQNGVWYTHDAGATWNQISLATIPPGIQASPFGTSTTSMAIGTGSKSFTVTFASSSCVNGNNSLVVGQQIQIWETSNPSNQLLGTLTSCSGTTLVVNVGTVAGSGTHTDWTMGANAGATSSIGGMVAFDPSDATGSTAYIAAYGTGLFKCTSAKTTPSCSSVSGSPTTYHTVYVDALGTVWIVDNTGPNGGQVLRYLSGAWTTQLTVSGNQWTSIAVDPSATSNAYVTRADGCVNYTLGAQGGSPSWSGCGTWTKSGSVIVWQVWDSDTFLSLNTLAFDPSASHQMYAANGDGVYQTTAQTSGSSLVWNVDVNQGIENLDLTDGQGMSGGGVQWTAQDRPLWYYTSYPLTYPVRYYPDHNTTIRWGKSSCNNIVANTFAGVNLGDGMTTSTAGINGTYNYSGNSSTGLPGGWVAGKCIIIDSSHYIWAGFGPGIYQPYFTSNSGSSWTACTFDQGAAASNGWVDIAQDTTSPGVVVIFGNGGSNTGVWEMNSLTSCAFTRQSPTIPSGLAGHIQALPGKSCTFIMSAWAYPPSGLPGFGPAYLTTNCGGSFGSAIAGVNSILASGVGLPTGVGNDGYPAFIYQGWYNNGITNTFSIWEIDNLDSTPLAVDLDTHNNGSPCKGYPACIFDDVAFITGDLSMAGLVYGGFADNGGFYRHP